MKAASAEIGMNAEGPERLSDDDLKQFVKDFVGNLVYSDRHLVKEDEIPMTFMGLHLLISGLSAEDRAKVDPYFRKIGLIYEYHAESLPRSMNGHPCFMTHRFLHQDDWNRAKPAISKLLAQQVELGP